MLVCEQLGHGMVPRDLAELITWRTLKFTVTSLFYWKWNSQWPDSFRLFKPFQTYNNLFLRITSYLLLTLKFSRIDYMKMQLEIYCDQPLLLKMKFTVTGLFSPLKTYKNIFLRITSYRLVTLQFLSPGRSSTNLYKALQTSYLWNLFEPLQTSDNLWQPLTTSKYLLPKWEGVAFAPLPA